MDTTFQATGEAALGMAIEKGHIDAADDIWPKWGLVSKSTRTTGSSYFMESIVEQTKDAGGLDAFLTKHKEVERDAAAADDI